MANEEKLYVQITKNTTKGGAHYFPNEEIPEILDKDKKVDAEKMKEKRSLLESQGYFYGKKSCEKVEVTQDEFFYYITRDKGVTACGKDVIQDEKTGDLKVVDKKKKA